MNNCMVTVILPCGTTLLAFPEKLCCVTSQTNPSPVIFKYEAFLYTTAASSSLIKQIINTYPTKSDDISQDQVGQ